MEAKKNLLTRKEKGSRTENQRGERAGRPFGKRRVRRGKRRAA